MPLVDVVIPIRDVDEYLAEALASVAAQRDVELGAVVVVDGGSSTPIVLPDRGFGDLPVTLVRSEEPLTAGGGRNRGAAVGSAPWLAFLDADDRWPADSRAQLIAACTAAEAGLAFGTFTEFHSDEESARRLERADAPQAARVAGGIVVARSAWEAVGPFDEHLNAGEFIEWFNRARAAGLPMAATEIPALERRIHVGSTTATQIHAGRDAYLEVVRRWMNRTDS